MEKLLIIGFGAIVAFKIIYNTYKCVKSDKFPDSNLKIIKTMFTL